jgi:hypothetical protein
LLIFLLHPHFSKISRRSLLHSTSPRSPDTTNNQLERDDTHIIIVLPENIGRNDTGKVVSVLVIVRVVLHVDQALAVRIAKVGAVRRAEVDGFFDEGVFDLDGSAVDWGVGGSVKTLERCEWVWGGLRGRGGTRAGYSGGSQVYLECPSQGTKPS